MGSDDRKRDARVYVTAAEERVLGKRSRAWEDWWKVYGCQPELLHTACLAAVLSLGAPPHPEYLTQDASKSLPCFRPTDPNYTRRMREHDLAQRIMWLRWNRRLNEWATEQGLCEGSHKHWALAQFRKFFHAWLHACKEIDRGRLG